MSIDIVNYARTRLGSLPVLATPLLKCVTTQGGNLKNERHGKLPEYPAQPME